jgi:hypothetical protein
MGKIGERERERFMALNFSCQDMAGCLLAKHMRTKGWW